MISSFSSALSTTYIWRYGDMWSRPHLIQRSTQIPIIPTCNFLFPDQLGIPLAVADGVSCRFNMLFLFLRIPWSNGQQDNRCSIPNVFMLLIALLFRVLVWHNLSMDWRIWPAARISCRPGLDSCISALYNANSQLLWRRPRFLYVNV